MGHEQKLSYTKSCFLTAGECDITCHMPPTLLVNRIIEVATEHANLLHIGYADLRLLNLGWVLSRVSIAMTRWPGINETYAITTWVEGFNRLYSDRCFEFRDGEGRVLGHARTMWAAIDTEKRTAGDLSPLHGEQFINPDMHCPMPRNRKIPPVSLEQATLVQDYVFQYCDLDFNGHVNSVRYLEHILNLWSPDIWQAYAIEQLELAYMHECRYGQTATIKALEEPGSETSSLLVDLSAGDTRAVAARLALRHRG